MREKVADGTPCARHGFVRVLGLGLAALLVAMSARPVEAARLALAPGDQAPATWTAAVGAKASGWYQWKGAPITVVNFWATWCAFCKTEMPALESLRARLGGKGLDMYGVVMDAADDAAVLRFTKDLSVGYPILRGSPEISELWGGIGLLPTTFVVDSDGRILRRYVGSTAETVRRMTADIEALVAERAPGPHAPVPPPAKN